MFTGIVSAQGTVLETRPTGAGRRVVISAPWGAFQLGESIAIDGACMTVVAWDEAGFEVDVSPESLQRTTLGLLVPGDRVNLERAMRLGDAVGGHLVSGHVDGTGALHARQDVVDCARLTFRCPSDILRTCIGKGSIAVAGVSLTVNEIDDEAGTFSVMVIPHTLAVTTLGALRPGGAVNLEADLLGKMVERLLAARLAAPGR